MRISDRSSDVCSSDLDFRIRPQRQLSLHAVEPIFDAPEFAAPRIDQQVKPLPVCDLVGLAFGLRVADRSEEHTSELQSLMRISYAVFCLKKKNSIKLNNKIIYSHYTHHTHHHIAHIKHDICH